MMHGPINIRFLCSFAHERKSTGIKTKHNQGVIMIRDFNQFPNLSQVSLIMCLKCRRLNVCTVSPIDLHRYREERIPYELRIHQTIRPSTHSFPRKYTLTRLDVILFQLLEERMTKSLRPKLCSVTKSLSICVA